MSKKLLTLCALCMFAVSALFAGCGQDSSDKAASSGEKVLRVGTNADFAPFEFQDENGSTEYQGFDMDLIRAVAKEMGYTAEIQNVNFDGLIPAMESGNIDIIASGMTINEERKNQVEFSDPYYTSGLTIVVPKDNTDINGFADLKGKKIAVQIGTTSMEEAQKIEGAEVKALNSSADTFMELKAGNVDAVINDLPVNDYYIVKTKATDVKRLDDKLTSEEYGFAMKKGNIELKQKVDAALKTLKENGEYDKIYEKWFGTKPAK